MPLPTQTDFSQYANRSEITNKFMKFKYSELVTIFIRVLAYMEVGDHKDRQTFWEYLEKIVKENDSAQLVLDQTFTERAEAVIVKSMAESLTPTNKVG